MDTSRLAPGDWIAAVGGVVLLISLLFFDWYSLEPDLGPLEIGASFLAQAELPEIPEAPIFGRDLGAWDEQGFLGTIANLVMLVAGVWAVVALALRSGVAEMQGPRDPGSVTAALGVAAAVMVLLRMIFPADEINGVDFDASLKLGIFVALIGAVLIALGGVMTRSGTTAQARPGPRPPSPPRPGAGPGPGPGTGPT